MDRSRSRPSPFRAFPAAPPASRKTPISRTPTLTRCRWSMPRAPKGDLCVVDARGTSIGRFIGESSVLRAFKGNFYNFSIDQTGTQKTAAVLYQSTNCSGTPYLTFDNVFATGAVSDVNNVLWTPGDTLVSLNFLSFEFGAQCFPNDEPNHPAGIAKILDASTPKHLDSWARVPARCPHRLLSCCCSLVGQ